MDVLFAIHQSTPGRRVWRTCPSRDQRFATRTVSLRKLGISSPPSRRKACPVTKAPSSDCQPTGLGSDALIEERSAATRRLRAIHALWRGGWAHQRVSEHAVGPAAPSLARLASQGRRHAQTGRARVLHPQVSAPEADRLGRVSELGDAQVAQKVIRAVECHARCLTRLTADLLGARARRAFGTPTCLSLRTARGGCSLAQRAGFRLWANTTPQTAPVQGVRRAARPRPAQDHFQVAAPPKASASSTLR